MADKFRSPKNFQFVGKLPARHPSEASRASKRRRFTRAGRSGAEEDAEEELGQNVFDRLAVVDFKTLARRKLELP